MKSELVFMKQKKKKTKKKCVRAATECILNGYSYNFIYKVDRVRKISLISRNECSLEHNK